MEILKRVTVPVVIILMIFSAGIPTFAIGESGEKVVDIDVNGGEAIKNELIRGSIEGIKTDDKGQALEGAVFGLFKEKETDLKEENAILTDISDKAGLFSFDDVPFGKYKIYEILPPAGYQADGKVYEAVIDNDKKIVEISACNYHIVPAKTGDKYKLYQWKTACICSLMAGILIYIGYFKVKNHARGINK